MRKSSTNLSNKSLKNNFSEKEEIKSFLKNKIVSLYKNMWDDTQSSKIDCIVENKKKWKLIAAFFVIIFFVILSLFRHWEMSGESWVYWYFWYSALFDP